MQLQAQSKSLRIAPRKVQLVAALIRNKKAEEALRTLTLTHKRAVKPLEKLLKSAIANALHNAKANKDSLMVKSVEVSNGPALKRFHPSTRGRVHPYKKRSSHIRIVLEEKK